MSRSLCLDIDRHEIVAAYCMHRDGRYLIFTPLREDISELDKSILVTHFQVMRKDARFFHEAEHFAPMTWRFEGIIEYPA